MQVLIPEFMSTDNSEGAEPVPDGIAITGLTDIQLP